MGSSANFGVYGMSDQFGVNSPATGGVYGGVYGGSMSVYHPDMTQGPMDGAIDGSNRLLTMKDEFVEVVLKDTRISLPDVGRLYQVMGFK